jgi:hypothetical protein
LARNRCRGRSARGNRSIDQAAEPGEHALSRPPSRVRHGRH